MKLTPNLRQFIATETAKWMRLLSTNFDTMVVTSRKQVLALPLKFTKGRRTTATKYFGVCYHVCNETAIIFLNVKLHTKRVKLRETIVHELCHIRFPYRNDGATFDWHVNKIIKTQMPHSPYNGKHQIKKHCNDFSAIDFSIEHGAILIPHLKPLIYADMEDSE